MPLLVSAFWLVALSSAAVRLPDNVGSPGAGRIAVGVGAEGNALAADLRAGVLSLLSVKLEGVWHSSAPLVGGGVQIAAGRLRGALSAHAWLEGHLRPVVSTDITRPLAGGDLAVGVGVTVGPNVEVGPVDLIFTLEGGLGLGLPAFDVELEGLDPDAMDQQGGLFGVERIGVAADLGDRFELAVRATFTVPIGSLRFRRTEEELLERWNLQLGGRILLRF